MKDLRVSWLSLMTQIKQNGRLIEEDDEPYLELLDQRVEFTANNAFALLDDSRIMNDFQEMEKVFFTNQNNAFGHSYLNSILTPTKEPGSFIHNIANILKKKPSSRKAVLTFSPYGENKIPCINCVHFLHRDDSLHLSYFARGQDIFRKFPCDALCIIRMGQMVAEELDLPLGTITGNISSAHIYLQDLKKLEIYHNEAGFIIPKIILTTNAKKYFPLMTLLKSLDLELLHKDLDLPEIQSTDHKQVISNKARAAYELLGYPVWVDDSFLLSDEYPQFPGPLTKYIFKTLGIRGFESIFIAKSKKVRMLCLMAYFDGRNTHIVQGEAAGFLDFSKEITDEKMPLSSIFIGATPLQHRIEALKMLASYRRDAQVF